MDQISSSICPWQTSSLLFASKARAGEAPALLTSIGLSWKDLPRTISPDYFAAATEETCNRNDTKHKANIIKHLLFNQACD